MVALFLLLCTLFLGTHAKHTIEESDFMMEDHGVDAKDEYGDIFKLYDFTLFPDETDPHQRNKRYALPQSTSLCLMTFNIENYFGGSDNRNRNLDIAAILQVADFISVQEMRNAMAAKQIQGLLDSWQVTKNQYECYQSGPLPAVVPSAQSRQEYYAFFYKKNIIQPQRYYQVPPLTFSNGKVQTRPPHIVEFRYTLTVNNVVQRAFSFTVVPIHTIPDGSSVHTTREEINYLRTSFLHIVNTPNCFSGNGIILGDFNQVQRYVLSGFRTSSDFVTDQNFVEVEYTGSSSARTTNPDNKLDRIYIYGPVLQTAVAPQALNWDSYQPFFAASQVKVSDHYPILFSMDLQKMGDWFTPQCNTYGQMLQNSQQHLQQYNQHQQQFLVGTTRCRRQVDTASCETCLAVQLQGGVHPAGAISSSSALAVTPTPIHRGDAIFWRMFYFNGDFLIFQNEEHTADWCDSPGNPCFDCRGITDVTIYKQCADRIMCPVLAEKLMELTFSVKNCFENRTLIVHEAWDEPDSQYPNGRNSPDSLYTSGQEAEISISEPIPEDEIISQRDYNSDNSLLDQLASLAVCIGIEYVKINSESNTISVAVRTCFDGNTSIPTCQEPSISNGIYAGVHDGPIFQEGETIHAICEPGYRLDGPIFRYCIGDNEWLGSEPLCVRVCNELLLPECAVTVYDYDSGSVTFECESGCIPTGRNSPLVCNPETLQFEGENTLVCSPGNTTCPDLFPPYKGYIGYIEGVQDRVGSVAQFSCESGFTLVGHPLLTCTTDGEWDEDPPTCAGDIAVSEFSILGFEYLRTDIPVNPFEPSSLASATFTGRLSYPPFTLMGVYNTTSETVKFKKQLDLPFGGLSLAYTVEVDLAISQIVNRSFHGILLKPLRVDVIGNFNGIECLLDLRGEVEVPSEDIGVRAGVILEFCDNCSRICSAQAVSLSVALGQPWNISLNGSYMLADNITTVSVGGAVDIQNINIEVLATLRGNISLLSVQDLSLTAHLPEPIGTVVEGRYSANTGVATFSGTLNIQQIQFSLQLTADIANKTLSDLTFSGNLTSPFFVALLGSYKLSSNMSNLNVVGMLNIDGGFLLLSLTVQLDLSSHTVLHYDFMGSISEPLAVVVRAHYGSMLPVDELELCGSIGLQNNIHAIAVYARLNISTSPISLTSITVNGVFPPPLDFISLSGVYMRQCSCAFISGTVMREDFTLTTSTNLTLFEGEDPSINHLDIEVHFHRPLNLFLRGQYVYTDPNSSHIVLYGTFDLSQITLSTELLLVISGMSSLTISRFHFDGTFPFPLNLEVSGDYSSTSRVISLAGGVQYSFAELNASTEYVFMDNVHNVSSSLRDLQFMGTLTTPFPLTIHGLYIFETEIFSLTGSLLVNQYLTLDVYVFIDTTSNPISVDTITFTGTLMTPIQFEGEFQGNFDFRKNTATLNSSLRLRSSVFSAKALLSRQGNSSFELENIMVSGHLPSPLSIFVTGIYIPGNITDLYLVGNLTLGPFTLEGIAHAQQDSVLVLKEVSFRGTINDPFTFIVDGNYSSGNTLTLSGSLDLAVLYLVASTQINLTATPRMIETIDFHGRLKNPLNGNVTTTYTQHSGELVLRGVTDLHSLHFSVEIYLNTTPQVVVRLVQFMYFFNPLSLQLVGAYSRDEQRIDLKGIISIPSPKLNITASTFLDLNEETNTLSNLTLRAEFERPPIVLTGTYISNQQVLLSGILNLANLQIAACAFLHLGDQTSLDTIMFNINYTIPFNENLHFQLVGAYNSTNDLILEGRIAEGRKKRRSIDQLSVHHLAKRAVGQSSQEGSLYALLILSTETSSVQVISLNIPEINVGSLLNTYLGIPWPSSFFPLIFRNIAIYRAYTSQTYDGVLYQEGFHARGEVKIFIFPEIIIDATMMTEPESAFQVSFNLRDPVDWRIFAICGRDDQTCSMSGPGLTIHVDSRNSKQFTFSGGFRLFQIYIGAIDITVKEERMEANVTLSNEVRQLFFNLLPRVVRVYWNDTSFHTSLSIPGLMLPDLSSLTDIASPGICEAIGGAISRFAIDAPFHLQTQLLARLEEDGTLLFGVVLSGYVDLEIAGQNAVRVNIRPIYFAVNIPTDQPLTWEVFTNMIQQAIKRSAGDIIDGILQNSEAYATLVAANVIQEGIGEAAEALCDSILDVAAAEITAISTEVTAVTVGVLTTTSEVGRRIVCGIVSIFGGSCSSDDDDDDDDSDDDDGDGQSDSESINDILQQLSCSSDNAGCQQTCTQDGLFAQCSCSDGYFLHANGRSCIRFNRCTTDANPCDANATCMDPPEFNRIMCICNAGYTGDGMNCRDINECEVSGSCPVYSSCTNTEGSFNCICDSGFYTTAQGCEDIDECADTVNCTEHSYCVNVPGSYSCECDQGYMANGSACIDINECSSDGCGPHSTCTNTEGSFSCSCFTGYRWNGSMCLDINECNELSPCDETATCSNTDGSFLCTCNMGFIGNGINCTDLNECEDNTSCDPLATCTNTEGSYVCLCDDGYTGNGTYCSDVDECENEDSDCAEQAVCTNTIGSYTCECLPGFTGNGSICEDTDECAAVDSPCSPVATCNNTVGSFLCECNAGYSGDGFNCTDIDECLTPQICDEFASCENTDGSFVCTCNYGFTGDGQTCSLVNCGHLELPLHTQYVSMEGAMFNQTASVQCLPGFEPEDVFELTCGADGTWNGSLPNCIASIFCPEPVSPMNGDFVYGTPLHTPHPSSIVLYMCDFGYTLVGDSMLSCLPDGNWSAPMPICEEGLSVEHLYPFGSDAGDTLMARNDDGSEFVELSVIFPFFDEGENTIFVNNNGMLSFGVAVRQYTPEAFPLGGGRRFIAPYWADVDTRLGFTFTTNGLSPEETGRVWYREAFEPELFERAAQDVRWAFVDQANFYPDWLFIATWESVGYYSRNIDKLNTFQCVLATDGRVSFASFLFPRGGVQWTTGDASGGNGGLGGTPAQSGINAGDGLRFTSLPGSLTADIINIDEGSNIMQTGLYLFRIDGVTVSSAGCDNITEGPQVNLVISPIVGTSLGGTLVAIAGPCFEYNSNLTCKFGDVITKGVVANPLTSYCVTPMLYQFGRIKLQVSLDGGASYPYTTDFTVVSYEQANDVQFWLENILLYSDGDNLTLNWNPRDVIPPQLQSQVVAHSVKIDVYTYSFDSEAWLLFQEIASNINNSGEAFLPTLQPGPETSEHSVVLMAFRIAPFIENSSFSDIPEYVQSLISVGQISIWSSVAYKVAIPDYNSLTPSLCQEWATEPTGFISVDSNPPCPCNIQQARQGNSMFIEMLGERADMIREFFHPGATSCFISAASLSGDESGQECCYDNNGNLLIWPPAAGTADAVSPRIFNNPFLHYLHDLLPAIHCCQAPAASVSSCRVYAMHRPSDNCFRFNPIPPAALFGDPHMVTLDGLAYTFNGAGEFVILDALNGTLVIQGRAEPAERVDHGISVGTAFSAIALRKRDSDIVEVQRSALRGVNILFNGQRTTFSEPTEWILNGLSVIYEGNDTVTIRFDDGESISVRVRNNFLAIEIAASPVYQNNTVGLLGVWNNNPDDDLLRPDGTTLSPNSTLEQIHMEFGELWRINASASLFSYNPGESPATYDNIDFTPVFELENLPFFNMSGAAEACGNSVECLFDVGSTGSIEVGQFTRDAQETHNEVVMLSQPVTCDPPCQQGAPCISNDVCNCPINYHGERCELDVDECALGLHNCDQVCNNTLGGFNCSCRNGFLLYLDEASCTDIDECAEGSHNCDHSCSNIPGSFLCYCRDGYFLLTDEYTCRDTDECAVGSHNCDQICNNTLGGFDCSCRDGFLDEGTSCTDVDECLIGTHNCAHNCNNIPGGFLCSCHDGFYLDTDEYSCRDIDECAMGSHNCDQICSNTLGSFNCSCRDGFLLNLDEGTSCADIDECLLGTHNCAHNCSNIPGGFLCSCQDGFYLDTDEYSCRDTDECALGSHNCDQICNNTLGGFNCSCRDGFHLNLDEVSCTDIDECTLGSHNCSHNCSNTLGGFLCSCRDGFNLDPDGYFCREGQHQQVSSDSFLQVQLPGIIAGSAVAILLLAISVLVCAVCVFARRRKKKVMKPTPVKEEVIANLGAASESQGLP